MQEEDFRCLVPGVAEVGGFEAECEYMLASQGRAFPFTRGFWVLSQLLTACYPGELGTLDHGLPLTKAALDALLGRRHTTEEYRYYFECNPHAVAHRDQYSCLLSEYGSYRRHL
jgi:hypothetical protein